MVSLLVAGQEKKEFRFTVGPKAIITTTNNYGFITVKPSGSNQVVLTTASYSDGVTFENDQHGDRIDLRSNPLLQEPSLVDYTVAVPAASFVSLRSSGGKIHAQGLRGDIGMETATTAVEVSDIDGAHIHGDRGQAAITHSPPTTEIYIFRFPLGLRLKSSHVP